MITLLIYFNLSVWYCTDLFVVLDACNLMEHVIDIVDEVCQKWNKDLPAMPIPTQVHECYHYEIKNTRRKMEDRHVMLQDMNTLFDLKVNNSMYVYLPVPELWAFFPY